jgi:hypothetical protein
MTEPTAPPVVAPAPQIANAGWGAPITAVFSLLLLLAGLGVAYLTKDDQAILILLGIIGTNATTAVHYYLGSSRSSQQKDKIISAQLPPALRHPPL